MAIRNYTPSRRHRRGVSLRARNFLYAILIAAILLQISYPLIHGKALELVTLATVYCAAIAMVTHAKLSFGAKYALQYFSLVFSFGYLIELLGVHSGWPFGIYSYDASLGPALLGVPLVVPCAWVSMVHPVLCAARRIAGNWVFLYGGALLAAWDLFTDSQMVDAGRWSWKFNGAHIPFVPKVPLSNALGWLLAGMAIVALLHRVLPLERRKESLELGAVTAYLGWTLFAGVIGNIFFFGHPGLGIFGGFIFGALAIPFLFSSWLGRP
jgi:lycopene beta-cyclase